MAKKMVETLEENVKETKEEKTTEKKTPAKKAAAKKTTKKDEIKEEVKEETENSDAVCSDKEVRRKSGADHTDEAERERQYPYNRDVLPDIGL